MLFKASIIKIPIMLALQFMLFKASIIGILIMLALNKINYRFFLPTKKIGKVSESNLQSFCLQNLQKRAYKYLQCIANKPLWRNCIKLFIELLSPEEYRKRKPYTMSFNHVLLQGQRYSIDSQTCMQGLFKRRIRNFQFNFPKNLVFQIFIIDAQKVLTSFSCKVVAGKPKNEGSHGSSKIDCYYTHWFHQDRNFYRC